MEQPSIDILVTTMNKTLEEIKNLVKSNGLAGRIIVGNQTGRQSQTSFSQNNSEIILLNLSNVGVSRNRNVLLKASNADYVLFLDDDISLEPDFASSLAEGIKLQPNAIGIHFNIQSANPKRPIPQFASNEKLTFRKTTSLGVVGTLLKRSFLIDNNLFFDEDVGPGTAINHGEDTLFFRYLFKKTKAIYQNSKLLGTASQTASSWWGKNQKDNLVGVGYMYRKMFGPFAFLFGIYHSLKHRSHYKELSWTGSLKAIKQGICLAKKSNR